MPSIEKNLQILLTKISKLEQNEEFSPEMVADAADFTEKLLMRINDLQWSFAKNDQKNTDFDQLQAYLKTIAEITMQLNAISKNELDKAPDPDTMMYNFANSFDKFITQYISKRNQQNLNNVLQYIPVVSDVTFYAENIPYYWHYANTQEKTAMVLSVVMTSTAIAIGIAISCSPAVAALPMITPIMWGMVTCGRSLFNSVIANSKKHQQQIEKTKELTEKLDHIEDVIRNNFGPAPSLTDSQQKMISDDYNAKQSGHTEKPRNLFTPGASHKTSTGNVERADLVAVNTAVQTVHELADHTKKDFFASKRPRDPAGTPEYPIRPRPADINSGFRKPETTPNSQSTPAKRYKASW